MLLPEAFSDQGHPSAEEGVPDPRATSERSPLTKHLPGTLGPSSTGVPLHRLAAKCCKQRLSFGQINLEKWKHAPPRSGLYLMLSPSLPTPGHAWPALPAPGGKFTVGPFPPLGVGGSPISLTFGFLSCPSLLASTCLTNWSRRMWQTE